MDEWMKRRKNVSKYIIDKTGFIYRWGLNVLWMTMHRNLYKLYTGLRLLLLVKNQTKRHEGTKWERIRTRLLSGCKGCAETFVNETPARCELEPQGRSTGAVDGARQNTTQGHQHVTCIGGTIVDFQNIGVSLRVEFIKCNQYAVGTGYCDTPGTCLLVWVVNWIARAGKVSRVTSILITGAPVYKASKGQHNTTHSCSTMPIAAQLNDTLFPFVRLEWSKFSSLLPNWEWHWAYHTVSLVNKAESNSQKQ